MWVVWKHEVGVLIPDWNGMHLPHESVQQHKTTEHGALQIECKYSESKVGNSKGERHCTLI